MSPPNNLSNNMSHKFNHVDYIEDINIFDDILNDYHSLEDSEKEIDNTNIKKNKNNSLMWCYDCNTDDIVKNTLRGYFSCNLCGENLGNFMDSSSNFIDFEDKNGSSKGTYLLNKILPDISSQIIIKGVYNGVQNLQKWNSVPYKQKKLNDVFTILQNACLHKNIYKCIEDTAKIMYRQIYDNKANNDKNIIFRGANYDSLIAACLFMACKTNNYIISKRETELLFGLEKNVMRKGLKIFKGLAKEKKFNLKITITKPEDFIKNFFDRINITKNLLDQAIQLVKNIQKIQIANSHNPISIAVGAIYLIIYINNIPISKKELSTTFDISQVTIKKTFNKLEPFINILLNNKICDSLQTDINEYQTCIEYDLVYIAECIKFNVKYDFNKITKFDLEFKNKIMIIQDIEFINKQMLSNSMILKTKLNYLLIMYKSLEKYK